MHGTDLTSRDQGIRRRGLDIFDGMVKKLEDGERIEIADVADILKFLKLYEDEYPERLTIVGEIEAALSFKQGTAFVRSSRRLISLLRDHLDKERSLSAEVNEMVLAAGSLINFGRLEKKYTRKPQGTPLPGQQVARAHGAGPRT
jgi:hypothetical protein